jgi:hypothetical protein
MMGRSLRSRVDDAAMEFAGASRTTLDAWIARDIEIVISVVEKYVPADKAAQAREELGNRLTESLDWTGK